MPVPDMSDDDSDFESISNNNNASTTVCNSAIIPRFKGSISQPDLFSLAKSCNPDETFMSMTSTGIEYDNNNPIYKTKTCTLFIGRRNGHYYALKTSPFPRRLIHEWEIYKEIGKYPTIIEAVDLIIDQSSSPNHNSILSKKKLSPKYFLQLDYAFGGSISNSLQFFDSHDAWRVLAHVSSALNHMHQNGFIHLDISPANILICQNKQRFNICSSESYVKNVTYKLADFGTVIKEGYYGAFCEGSGPYVSPEALQYPHSVYPVSYPTDIWSLGAVMFEIVTHTKMPRDAERYTAIRRGELDLSGIIPEEFEIILHMLNVNPSMRPTAEQIVELPIVKEILEETESRLNLTEESYSEDDEKDATQKETDDQQNLYQTSARIKNRYKRLSDDNFLIRRESFDRI